MPARPAPQRRLRPLAVVAATLMPLAAIACSDDDPLRWQIEFASRSLGDRAAVVEARIVKGGCASEEVVYVSAFAPGEAGATPPELDDGTYGFIARALDDDCRWYAQGCTEAELPRDGQPVVVMVEPLPRETLDCDGNDCSSAQCGAIDAGRDGGGAAIDAGMDGGMDAGGAATDAATFDDAGAADAGDAGHPDDAAPPLEPIQISIEMEQGDPVAAPMIVVQDELASGGAYISYPVPEGATLEEQRSMKRATPPADDTEGGMALFEFEIPRAGGYRVWGRVIAPSLDDDSFWIRIDDGEWVQWNDISHQDFTWHWDDVRPFETRADRWIVPFSEGTHQLRVAFRELGARIDRMVLASELDWVPSD